MTIISLKTIYAVILIITCITLILVERQFKYSSPRKRISKSEIHPNQFLGRRTTPADVEGILPSPSSIADISYGPDKKSLILLSRKAVESSSSSSKTWRAGYDRVINNSFGSTWDFHGWWRVQSWNGGSRSAVAKFTSKMNFYPGALMESTSPLTKDTILITLFDNGDLQFQLKVFNAGKDCTGLQTSYISNACIVTINEGDTCDTAPSIGSPFFDSSKITWTNGNPFVLATYLSNSEGVSNSIINMFNGGNGYGVENDQRALVIYDSKGEGVLCGIIKNDKNRAPGDLLPTKRSTRPTPPPAISMPSSSSPSDSNYAQTPPPLVGGTPSPTGTRPILVPQSTLAPPQTTDSSFPPPMSLTSPPLFQPPIITTSQPMTVTQQPIITTQQPMPVSTSPPNNNSNNNNPMPMIVPTLSPNPPLFIQPPNPFPIPLVVPTFAPLPKVVPTLAPRLIIVPTFAPRPVIVPTFGPIPRPVIVPTFAPRPMLVPTIGPAPRVAPIAPKRPTAPSAPIRPIAPIAPIRPATPMAPKSPIQPKTPMAPQTPFAPKSPIQHKAPITPSAPQNPMQPIAPKAPSALQSAIKPIAPTAPSVAPLALSAPKSPKAVAPEAPSALAPKAPSAPENPMQPVAPIAPFAPKNPIHPVAPVAPSAVTAQPVLVVSGVLVKVIYNGIGWIAVAGSETGKMLGAKGTVVGLPTGPNTVSKNVTIYNMTSQDVAGIIPRSANQQYLQNASITQSDTVTVMEFKMPFVNPLGIFPVIWAYGNDNTFQYHGPENRGGAEILNLIFCENADHLKNDPACQTGDLIYDQKRVLKRDPNTNDPILTIYTKKTNYTFL